MKNLQYNVHINASKQKVWEIMTQPDTYKEWTAVSWPGSYYEGAWKEGEKIKFISKDGSGTLALIETVRLFEYIGAKHIAVLLEGGKEDYDSDIAKGWVGILENYTFEEKDGGTDLTVNITTNPNWQKMFDDGFPNALKELKKICER